MRRLFNLLVKLNFYIHKFKSDKALVIFVFWAMANFSAYSQDTSSDLQIMPRVAFNLQPNQQGILRILPKTDGRFIDNKKINFAFINTENCSRSSDYLVRLKWGPEESEDIIIPCGRRQGYCTGYGGGDVRIIITVKNPDTGRTVRGAVVSVTQPDACSDPPIPWK